MALRAMNCTLVISACAIVLGILMTSCEEHGKPSANTKPAQPQSPNQMANQSPTQPKAEDTHTTVTIAGKRFSLELALDDEHRFKGLSGRENIPPDGGMLFVFTRAAPQAFVMRDCPNPIDIIYLDANGRVISTYEMTPELPRTDAERMMAPPFPGAPAWANVNAAYEARLKPYPSRFPSQFVIELRGGTLPGLKLKPGDKVELAREELVRRAK